MLLLCRLHLLLKLFFSTNQRNLELTDMGIVTLIAIEFLTMDLVNVHLEVVVLTPVLVKSELGELEG